MYTFKIMCNIKNLSKSVNADQDEKLRVNITSLSSENIIYSNIYLQPGFVFKINKNLTLFFYSDPYRLLFYAFLLYFLFSYFKIVNWVLLILSSFWNIDHKTKTIRKYAKYKKKHTHMGLSGAILQWKSYHSGFVFVTLSKCYRVGK